MTGKIARALVHVAWAVALVVTCVGGASAGGAAAENRPILVFAAASLKNALDKASDDFTRRSGNAVTVSYAATSALARQIEAGAPADVFISADLEWMDYLQTHNLIRAGSRRNLLGNSLVLIAPAAAPADLRIGDGFPLAAALGDGRLAVANTAAVPAGKYARAALEKLGVWGSVEDRLAQADNVRAALALVSRGEAPLGIVYRTDAAADPNVVIVDTFPEDTHPPIIYPLALVAASDSPGAAEFVAFLASGEARGAFETEGFAVLPGTAAY